MASQLVDRTRNQALQQLTDRKDSLALGLLDISQALLFTGNHLREQGRDPLAQYATRVAEQLSRVSGTMRQKDVQEYLQGAQDFARRRPGLALSGVFVLGLLGARLFKSSARSSSDGANGQSDGVDTLTGTTTSAAPVVDEPNTTSAAVVPTT
jgi:hypothetical protein